MKLACVAQDRVDITRHMKDEVRMSELKRSGFRFGQSLLGKKEHDGGDCQARQTLAETHVVFANVCCIIKRRSRELRRDSRSVHELGNSVTLPRLADRCLD